MAGKQNIKGITIEINGDVTKLDKALAGVDRELATTQKNLKEVERLLKLDPSNVELLDQKQRLLAKGVEQTSARYETLKKTLEDATASNVKFAEWEQAQQSLQGQITKTENALTRLLNEQKKLEDLKFAPDSDQMQALQGEIDATRAKSEALRQQMADTFEQLGRPISVEQYDALQRELVQSKADMEAATKAAKDFETGADDMGNSAEEAGQGASKLDEALGALGLSKSALTAAGAIGLAAEAIKAIAEFTAEAVTSAAEYADNILTLSTNFGISTEKLQEYQYMSELVDTSVETITGSITHLTKSMDKARKGNEDVDAAFAALNIRVTDANGSLRDASEVFEEAVGALGRIHNETERDTIAMTLFGRSSMELNSLVQAMADGSFKDLQREAHEIGYVLSGEELDALGAVDDGFQRLDKAMEMAKNRIAIELAPEIIDLTNKLVDLIVTADWEAIGTSISIFVRDAAPLILEIAQAITTTAESVAYLIQMFDSLGKKVNSLPGSTGMNFRNDGTIRGVRGYASGGVFEPNSPMLIGVGDNRSEREVLAPESELRRLFREESGASGGGGNVYITATYTASDDQLVRVLAPKLEAYQARRGKAI